MPASISTSSSSSTAAEPGCPASDDARHAARINMPTVPNAPQSAAGAALSTGRLASTIPIADPSAVPPHQQGEAPAADGGGAPRAVWMYPSEQQFFNAMTRKGWAPQERDMPTVVAIHNTVNERAWAHVLGWESLHACDCPDPKLLRFRGRPTDYSPKARLLNLLVRGAAAGARVAEVRCSPHGVAFAAAARAIAAAAHMKPSSQGLTRIHAPPPPPGLQAPL